MEKRCVNVYSYNTAGQVSITSFCFERSALRYAAEERLSTYKIMVGDHVIRREGV
jgi:hypothetical protein